MTERRKRVSKLTDIDIKRAALQHLQGIEDDLEYDLMDAFAVGAKWGAQRTVKDNATDGELMWNREKLNKAAMEWADSKNPTKCDWDAAERTFLSFLAGCEYIIKQIQKEKEK